MLNKKGFSLVELLIGMVIMAILATAVQQLISVMMRATTAQISVATTQSKVRTGVIGLPQEFREIGYDTMPLAVGGAITSDLEEIKANRLTFRAMRGVGITCGTPSLTEIRILKPVIGLRDPLLTDGFLLFVENTKDIAQDDQWVNMAVSAIDYTSDCSGKPAIRITLASTPMVTTLAQLTLSLFFVGAPVRWYERLEYAPYIDPTTNEAHVGVRSLSLGEANLSPVIGPMPDTSSFRLTYYNSAGTLLDPNTAPVGTVRVIGVSITGVAPANGSLAGSTKRGSLQTVFSTQVALRNTLRP